MTDPTELPPSELSPNPFEGIDMFAPIEDLAIAEIKQRMLEVGQGHDAATSALETRLLGYQLVLVEQYLDEQRQGHQMVAADERSTWLEQEMEALGSEANVDKRSLESGSIVADYGTAARWRLSQVDPSTIDSTEKNYIEARWHEASGYTRHARIRMLEAEIVQLDVNARIAKVRGEDTTSYQAQRDALYAEKYKLNRFSYGAIIRNDNGTG